MVDSQFVFNRRRDFGDVVGDGFQFIIKNFKSLFTGFLMYVGPFVLLSVFTQGSIMNMFAFDPMSTDIMPFQLTGNLLLYMLAILAASIMLISFTYGVVQKYQATPDERISDNLWPYVQQNIGKVFIAILGIGVAYALVMVVFFGLGSFLGIGGFLLVLFIFIPIMIWLWVPLSLAPYIYVSEEVDLVEAVRRAFYLVKENWWSTFAILLVIAIIAVVASSIFSMPAYVISMSQALGSGGDLSQMNYGAGFYILSALGSLGSMFGGIYQLLGTILQYHNLSEMKDGTGLMERIDEIDDEGVV